MIKCCIIFSMRLHHIYLLLKCVHMWRVCINAMQIYAIIKLSSIIRLNPFDESRIEFETLFNYFNFFLHFLLISSSLIS